MEIKFKEAKSLILEKDKFLCEILLGNSQDGKGYVCPFCGHGKGGDGLTFIKPKGGRYTGHTLICFGCERQGNIIDFYMEMEEIKDIKEAMSKLLNMIGYSGYTVISDYEPKEDLSGPIENLSDHEQKTSSEAEQPQKETEPLPYYEEYADTTHRRICEDNNEGMAYLNHRGISYETVVSYNIGYDDSYQKHCASVLPRIVFFRNGFNSYNTRQIEADSKHYIVSSGTSFGVFNGELLAETDSSYDSIIVCEGEIDALSLCELNIPAIALSSKGNGQKLIEQLDFLKVSHDKKFIVTFDNEVTDTGEPDEQKDFQTRKQERELTEQLNEKGYKAISFNVAGTYHDINECLIHDKEQLKSNAAEALRELNKDDFDLFMEKIETEAYKKHSTGLSFLDRVLDGGLMNQTLTILLASPATGKTSLCQQLSEAYARDGRDVIYICLEMSSEQLMSKDIARCFCDKYASDPKKWISGTDILQMYEIKRRNPKLYQELKETMAEYHKNVYPHLRYITGTSNNISEIMKTVNQRAEENILKGKETPVVILDYLHLLQDNRAKGDTAELLKNSMKDLKNYAVNYNSFVFTISATGRKASEEGLTMYSGRDSSNIEYTADNIIGLDYFEHDIGNVEDMDSPEGRKVKDEPLRRLIIKNMKMRGGSSSGYEKVYFNKKATMFYSSNDPKLSKLFYRSDEYKPVKFYKKAESPSNYTDDNGNSLTVIKKK